MALNFPTGASMVLVATTAPKTIILPNPDPGRFLQIVDSTGNANVNNIYISTAGSGVSICNGYSTIAKSFGLIGYVASGGNWYAIQNESGTNSWNNVIASNISAATLSTNYGFFSTISSGNIYGKHYGDGSALTGITSATGAGVTSTLSTLVFLTSSISSAYIISQQGYISSLTVDFLTLGFNPGYVSMGDIIATSLSTIAIQVQTLTTGTLTAGNISTISISTNYGFFSTISAGTFFGKYVGDASLLTNIPNNGAVLSVSNAGVTNTTNITTVSNISVYGSNTGVTNTANILTVSNIAINGSNTGVTNTANILTISNTTVTNTANILTISNTTVTNTANITTVSNIAINGSNTGVTNTANILTISNTTVTNTANILTVSNTTVTNTANITTVSNIAINGSNTGVTNTANILTVSNIAINGSNTGVTNTANITTVSNIAVNGSNTGVTNATNITTVSNTVAAGRFTAISTNTISTTNIQTSNILIGTVSSQSYLAFAGLQQQYAQSVLAEVSIGTGLQEMLLFRGSTATDRIRMQTTGSIIFETGVGARVFPAAPSNVTPAMIINTSSNVGIGIAAPTVTLDVAGAGRFQTLSTQQVYASSFIGSVVSSATVYAMTVSSLAGFFSTVNNYQIGGALYLPTQLFTF